MEQMKPYILFENMDEFRNKSWSKWLDKDFTGYYWLSDQTAPEVVEGKFTLPETGKNPFIEEANIYAKDGSVSISIEHNDGRYLIGIVEWNLTSGIELEETEYLTHRLKGDTVSIDYSQAKLVRAWIPIRDPECEDMEVLQPAWRAFKGFIEK